MHKDETLRGEQWALEEIKPYAQNAKIHDEKQIKELAASISEFGWRSRILVESDGTIIAGHGRFATAQHLKLATVPVTVADDLSDTQIKALRLADNKVTSNQYDTGMLMDELELLHINEEFDMSSWFSSKELDFATVDMAEMDFGALTEDIQLDVLGQAEDTQAALEKELGETFPVSKALGFSKVDAAERREITLFIAHLEDTTGLKGAAALAKHAKEVVYG